MRPPVSTGIASAKMPRGASTAFRMSCTGRCQSASDQSTGGRCCARSNDFAAPIPVALLVVGTDAADAGTESLDVHGRICRVPECGDAHLILRRRRAPGGPDLPVRPRLLRQPVDGVVAVASRRAEDVVVALGEEVAVV